MYTDYYKRIVTGAAPVDVATFKSYAKISTTSDDTLIQTLIDVVTEYGEKYTGREFRINQWELLIDVLTDRICINRNPVNTIDSIEHLVSDVLTAIPSADYYKKDLTTWAEILLVSGAEWPSNTDDKEHAVKITFTTAATQYLNIAIDAIMRHVLYLYENRGDCGSMADSAQASGAMVLYNAFRIPVI